VRHAGAQVLHPHRARAGTTAATPLAPGTSRCLSTPTPESLCLQHLSACSLGVNPVGVVRAFWTGVGIGRGPAQVWCACLWRSCASGVQCMAQLAVEVGRCGSRGAAPKGRARALAPADWGLASAVFLWCTAAGAGWRSWQRLLRCCRASRPRSPDACAACVDATRQQRENPRGTGAGAGHEGDGAAVDAKGQRRHLRRAASHIDR
jgi:hypothetical protein